MSPEGHEEARHDLGVCESLTAESIGPPGERHFRIRAIAERGTATLWLEKEELQRFGVVAKQLTGTRLGPGKAAAPPAPEEEPAADFDFKVEHLALGHHRERGLYVLLAHDSHGDEKPALALWADLQRLDSLADQAFAVCAAGRPRCFLCGAPINEGTAHVCPRANGHVRR